MEGGNKDFHHPYRPYAIQVDFMNALYDCIEQKQVGIFESPTGTGKSLSLICGALTWLREHRQRAFEEQEASNCEEPQWVVEYSRQERQTALLQSKKDLEVRLAKVRAKELREKQRCESGESYHKRIRIDSNSDLSNPTNHEARYMLDDYVSDEESIKKRQRDMPAEGGLSAHTFELLDKLGMIVKPTAEDELPDTNETKIFYSSRTHSQLSQFANEVRQVKIQLRAETDCAGEESEPDVGLVEEVRHLTLGSRKNLCINLQVSKLGETSAINERCLELQQPGTTENHKCAFLPKKENQNLVNDFRDHTMAKVRDIEDLGALGKKIGICPYYASRTSIKPSEIVTLPYQLLLQKSAREALDISLKDHIVIIDEAHNLMDAISSIYSVTISLSQLRHSRAQLGVYLQKFRNKLKGKNRVYVTQIVRLIDSLATFLEITVGRDKAFDGIVQVSDLMSGKGVDQINLYKLMRYLQESKLARKVEGYTSQMEQFNNEKPDLRDSTTPILTRLQSFFYALINPATEGRFFFSKTGGTEIHLKYVLLDPTHHFKDIVDEARAVILAGGTMSPMEDYTRHLLHYVDPGRLKTLSCGHVIPDRNLLAWPVTKTPSGAEFDFTYEQRNSRNMITDLGNSIFELSQVVPDGLVVFFPSYAYLEQVVTQWKIATLGQMSVWDNLLGSKRLFRESKETTSGDDILKEYSNAVDAGGGALLLSVVGGKMSEGINFSDRLGRGVVIVGLPFPNVQGAEWKAKLEYIKSSTISRGGTAGAGEAAGCEMYENTCMRAVNQSIGRAIRHQKDYATIVMLDRRYNTPRVQEKLPSWIRKGLVNDAGKKSFSVVTSSIRKFFGEDRET